MTGPAQTYTSIVDGTPQPATGPEISRENPGRKEETAARWFAASPAVARHAVSCAAAGFARWSQTPRDERIEILAALLDRVASAATEFTARITRENGKTLAESRAEIAAALADARFLLDEAQRDEVSPPQGNPGVRPVVALEPVGVFLLVTPWNFPVATILRKLIPALAHGNTAIVKPSELAPGPAHLLFEILRESPDLRSAAHLVLGAGSEIVPAMLGEPALKGVSFTGSTNAGLAIARQTAGADIRLQLEMGGKNTVVVLDDADLELAVAETARGGFSCAGQWCTGTGRVVVVRDAAKEFSARLAGAAAALRPGPGDEPRSQMGPVVSEACVARTLSALQDAKREGVDIVTGGARAAVPGLNGHFLQPTVVTAVTSGMKLWTEELFAPVIPIAECGSDDEAVALANAGRYGLSASVFSRQTARGLAVGRRIEAGMLHINLHTAYREPALPVGGWRDSGRGIPECGRFARDFFTRARAIYIRSAP